MPITPAVSSNNIETLQIPSGLGEFNKAFDGSGAVDYTVPIINAEDDIQLQAIH
jgi:hypothetical protein